jgi:hypothetical protein
MPIPAAEEVTIQIRRINWELLDEYYRYEWDDPQWLARKSDETEDQFKERMQPVDEWYKRKEKLLESIARRIKYEILIKRVVARGHIGKLTPKSVYDMEPETGIGVDYQVLSTKPGKDVRISEDTLLVLKEAEDRN